MRPVQSCSRSRIVLASPSRGESVPTTVDVLRRCPEELPQWLQAEQPTFNRSEFFGGRTVYYPGSGFDGQPVKLCAKAHAAHSFIYVDYGVERSDIAKQIADSAEGFRGYAVGHQEAVEETRLRPGGWRHHVDPSKVDRNAYQFASVTPFAWLVVLCREGDYDDAHGPERLAILFLGGDGFATFDALYCQADATPAPYLVYAKDHGCGGNWNRFGRGGLLEYLATTADRRPKYLLAAGNAKRWAGYEDTGAEGLYILPTGCDLP